ncbi:dimethylaniline monooxygenase (N-oxide forming) [Coprinopsis sp. MPI-PUGE-AT-0042]|nr:dimethylaniline monooxygenase (N-oxide forming) [Coprinopsis sp. MPI-PUGE-AT-0042]
MEEVDLVVVGAGWYGLAAAKAYIELHPDEEIIVLEGGPSIGGVWSHERLYPDLKSNNMLGTYEYSDFTMDTATFGVKPGEHIPGTVVHKYLTSFAHEFGVYSRTRLNTRVDSAEENLKTGNWTLNTRNTLTGEEALLHTKKLIVATGLTSEPHLPTFKGKAEFNAPIFHSKDFRDQADTLTTIRNIVFLGGAKSMWDAAYAYASAGVSVDIIIRKTGRGPVWMAPPYVTPLKKWLEKLVHTRFLTWLSPCIWGDEDGYGGIRRFLHGTWFGRKIVDAFWGILGSDAIDLMEFNKHPETKKLAPWHSAMWIGSGLSIRNFPTDFLDYIRNGQVRVHVADISHLSERTVHLSDGQSIKADALFCATGWKSRPPINFLPSGRLSELGLPCYSANSDPLVTEADSLILNKFPRLRDQPSVPNSETPNQPFQLYRFIVPPATLAKRNIAFAGMISTISTPICAQAQALWISSYFDGELDRLPSAEQARWITTLHARFGRWRYPCGYGARLPDFVFDAVPYLDMLLKDVGLESHRKSGRIAEWTEPYGPDDYKGLTKEWARKHGKYL